MVYQQYTYNFKVKSAKTKRWRCVGHTKHGCTAAVVTDSSNNFIRSYGFHAHPPPSSYNVSKRKRKSKRHVNVTKIQLETSKDIDENLTCPLGKIENVI